MLASFVPFQTYIFLILTNTGSLKRAQSCTIRGGFSCPHPRDRRHRQRSSVGYFRALQGTLQTAICDSWILRKAGDKNRTERGHSFQGIFPSSFDSDPGRSEEHTSELQSLRHLVCRLLLE